MRRTGYKSDLKPGIGPERFLTDSEDRDNYLFLLDLRDRIRDWLKLRGYLEVLVPTISPETAPDLNLESMPVIFQSVFNPAYKRNVYLQPSPELLMKRLIVSGFEKIFYLGSAYRQGELGEAHNPEFTMIEWYHRLADYQDLMVELISLLKELSPDLIGQVEKISLREAFLEFSGLDILKLKNRASLASAIKKKIPYFKSKGFSWEELFEFAFSQWLIPELEKRRAVLIYDWPQELSTQAKLKSQESGLCERFELYLKGIEVANGYTELSDARGLEKKFKREQARRRKAGKVVLPLPGRFLESIKSGFPECAGVSLGLERLAMAILGIANLDKLLPFREI